MEPEDKKLLKETFELTKENNKMLHKVRGVQKRQAFWNVLKILIILGIALGVFYYLEPYVNKLINIYSQISGINQGVNIDNGSINSSITDFLENYKITPR